MTLSSKAVSGVKWTSVSAISRAIIQLIQLSIVAHYLSAEALGIYALVQVTLTFCQIFMDMGIGNAIIHQQQTPQRILSELFIINLAIAGILSVSVYLFAPLFAMFFKTPLLADYIQLVSIVFIIYALSRIHLTQLQKKLAFSTIAKVELISALTGFVFAIVLIRLQYGIEALIYGFLTAASVQTLLFWLFSDFTPSLCYPRTWSRLQSYLSFGFYQTADATVNYFNSQFDMILVGKLLGTEVLGGYSLVRQFCFRPAMVINPVLTRVAFPVMAKLQHSKTLPNVYCKLVSALTLLNFPLYIALFVLAEPIVNLVFGAQWLHLTPTFQLMALWCLVRSVMNPVGSLLMAVGKVKLAFKWNSFLLLIIPTSIYLGSTFGLNGIAMALLMLQVLLLPGHWYFLLNKSVDLLAMNFFNALAIPLIAAIIAGFLVWISLLAFTNIEYWLQLVFGLMIGGLSYLLLVYRFSPFVRSLVKGHFSFE